jgi:hypothetical protein
VHVKEVNNPLVPAPTAAPSTQPAPAKRPASSASPEKRP